MKRLPLTLLLVFGISFTAFAQQKSEQAEAPASPADKNTPIIRFKASPASLGWIINYKHPQSGSTIDVQDISTSGSSLVFVDGAVYVAMPGSNVIVPLSGGGASGCFTLDLPHRRERLKNLIERFPPMIGIIPATRQLEAYAM